MEDAGRSGPGDRQGVADSEDVEERQEDGRGMGRTGREEVMNPATGEEKGWGFRVMFLMCILAGLAGLAWVGMWPISKSQAERAQKQAEERQATEKAKPRTLETEAAKLRKEHDSVHIYAVSNKFEVWCTHGLATGKWKDAETLEDARRVVNEYYLEWARNCIGPVPAGKLVE